MPAPGGRRNLQPDVPEALNATWRKGSFHSYADHALSSEFVVALDELIGFGRSLRLAAICSEAVWWRCHRRIIADYLLLNGHAVTRLMGAGREEPARPTPGAKRTADGKVLYPANG